MDHSGEQELLEAAIAASLADTTRTTAPTPAAVAPAPAAVATDTSEAASAAAMSEEAQISAAVLAGTEDDVERAIMLSLGTSQPGGLSGVPAPAAAPTAAPAAAALDLPRVAVGAAASGGRRGASDDMDMERAIMMSLG
eukprot:COSAG01_NODE_4197_length_5250_cov_33.117453_1_plen_138_part_10